MGIQEPLNVFEEVINGIYPVTIHHIYFVFGQEILGEKVKVRQELNGGGKIAKGSNFFYIVEK